MIDLRHATEVIFNEGCDRLGPFGEFCREWFKDKQRRQLTIAAGFILLTVVWLTFYWWTSQPDL